MMFALIKRYHKYLTKEMEWTACKRLAYKFVNRESVERIAKEVKGEVEWHVMRKV